MHPPTASSYLILRAGFLIDPPLQVICQSYVPLLLRSENNPIENDAELQIIYNNNTHPRPSPFHSFPWLGCICISSCHVNITATCSKWGGGWSRWGLHTVFQHSHLFIFFVDDRFLSLMLAWIQIYSQASHFKTLIWTAFRLRKQK